MGAITKIGGFEPIIFFVSMKFLAEWRNIPESRLGQEPSWPHVTFNRFAPISGDCAAMKVRDVLILLDGDGWHLVAMQGSHRQYKHPLKTGRVTVPGKPNDDLPPGTLNSILRQAGLKK